MFRAAVLEYAAYFICTTDDQHVAHEEHDADDRLGRALQQRLIAAAGRRHPGLGQEQRQKHEDPDGDDQRHEQREGHRAATEFHALARGGHGP